MLPLARLRLSLVLMILSGMTQAALAQTTTDYSTPVVAPYYSVVDQFSITTDPTSPVFNRPSVIAGDITQPPFTGLSHIGTAVAYGASSFTPSVDGRYLFTTTTSGYDPGNFIQVLYAPSFSPSDPLTNAQLAFNPNGTGGQYETSLMGGTGYTVVNAGYYNKTDTTPGDISLGTSQTTISQYHTGTLHEIPDNDPTGSSETLSLTGGKVTSLNSITITGLQHTYIGDLTASLTHDGVTVTLFDHTGASADNYYQGSPAAFDGSEVYTFGKNGADLTQTAAATVDAAYNANPFATYIPLSGGTYQTASNNLDDFSGLDLSGAWTLQVTDTSPADTGSYLGFSFNATTVPELSPALVMATGGFGLALLALLRRRKEKSQ